MNLRRFVLLLFLFSVASLPSLIAQVLDNPVYRVTAFKHGNPTVTSTSNYAEVMAPPNFYIPSAFSPNGDGLNDTFGVRGEGLKNYRIRIYNRWGEVIFESANPGHHWDGKYMGQPTEQGVYVYQIFANGISRDGKTGAVTVVY